MSGPKKNRIPDRYMLFFFILERHLNSELPIVVQFLVVH